MNTGSIAFHTRMGFQIEGVTREHPGVPCTLNYELNGQHRVLFVKKLRRLTFGSLEIVRCKTSRAQFP